jgi:hypothetical protein
MLDFRSVPHTLLYQELLLWTLFALNALDQGKTCRQASSHFRFAYMACISPCSFDNPNITTATGFRISFAVTVLLTGGLYWIVRDLEDTDASVSIYRVMSRSLFSDVRLECFSACRYAYGVNPCHVVLRLIVLWRIVAAYLVLQPSRSRFFPPPTASDYSLRWLGV